MGTRSDICVLLKDSQYLMEANQTELHNAVSGALDRLHYENDPCVKYDAKRKIWIYLHRGRTLEEFGMNIIISIILIIIVNIKKKVISLFHNIIVIN
jgi:hypothetical protein